MFKNPYKGKFIVFEGLDGSGSSTQAQMLASYLRSKKKQVHLTKEPTNYLIGGLIRSWLASDWSSSPVCLQLLFTADRAHHVEKEIIPLLKKGVSIVCDRYVLSTIAFGAVEISDYQWLKDISRNFVLPDATLLLKVRPKICIQRIAEDRHHFELFEREQTLQKVAINYERFAKEFPGVMWIDGEKSPEEVFTEVKRLLKY